MSGCYGGLQASYGNKRPEVLASKDLSLILNQIRGHEGGGVVNFINTVKYVRTFEIRQQIYTFLNKSGTNMLNILWMQIFYELAFLCDYEKLNIPNLSLQEKI